jgi:hypothetical protein
MSDLYTSAKNMPENWPENIYHWRYYDVGLELYSDTIKNRTMACMNAFIAWCRMNGSPNVEMPDYNIEDFLTAYRIVYFKDIVFHNDVTRETMELHVLATNLTLKFDTMVAVFRDNQQAQLHKEGITLAEQIVSLSRHDNLSVLFARVGNLEAVLRDYLLKFLPWRQKNKTQIMKKYLRDTIYKFLDMIRINGEMKVDYTNTTVQALQMDIHRLRRQINSHIESEPASSDEDFPRFIAKMDDDCAMVLKFNEGCGTLARNLDLDLQNINDLRDNGQITPREYRLNIDRFKVYKAKHEANLHKDRLTLEGYKEDLKHDADAIY